MIVLEHSKWENFYKVIKRTCISYRNSDSGEEYWLPDDGKPILNVLACKENIFMIGERFIQVGKTSKIPNGEVKMY